MSRPMNRIVVKNGIIFSISPKNLRSYLQGGEFLAKEIGMPEADVSAFDKSEAEMLLRALRLIEDTPSATVGTVINTNSEAEGVTEVAESA